MSKQYMNGGILKPAPQPAGLARYQARQQAKEAAALAPYGIEKRGRVYIVTYEGEPLIDSELTQSLHYTVYREYKTKREALEYINSNPDEITDETATETERPEIILNEKKEANTMKDYEFTADTLTARGKTFPAEYSISTDSVTVFVKIDETSNPARIRFNVGHPYYPAARAAAEEAAAAWKARRNGKKPTTVTASVPEKPAPAPVIEQPATERPETISTPAANDETPAPVTEQPAAVTASAPETPAETVTASAPETPAAVTAAAPDRADAATLAAGKAARGPVPEKTFIGETISGKGWRILFDGSESRTRVLFDEDPTAAALAELNAAGFYYSTGLNSWNKKLTFKAYRAAQALAGKLAAIYA